MSKRTFFDKLYYVFALPVFGMQCKAAVFQYVYVHLYNVVCTCAFAASAGFLYMLKGFVQVFKLVRRMCECKAIEELVRCYSNRFGPYAFGEYNVLTEHASQFFLRFRYGFFLVAIRSERKYKLFLFRHILDVPCLLILFCAMSGCGMAFRAMSTTLMEV